MDAAFCLSQSVILKKKKTDFFKLGSIENTPDWSHITMTFSPREDGEGSGWRCTAAMERITTC